MVNFGPLTAEIDWPVWGTPANFNGCHILASLLHRCRSTEVNQTLHNVWPSHALVYTIGIIRGSCPLTEFCQVQNSLCVQVLCSPILAALLHGTRAVRVTASAKLYGVVQGMERTFRSSSFSTQGATYIPTAATTLGKGPHSSRWYDAFHKGGQNFVKTFQ